VGYLFWLPLVLPHGLVLVFGVVGQVVGEGEVRWQCGILSLVVRCGHTG